MEKFICVSCNYKTDSSKNFDNHKKTKKHMALNPKLEISKTINNYPNNSLDKHKQDYKEELEKMELKMKIESLEKEKEF